MVAFVIFAIVLGIVSGFYTLFNYKASPNQDFLKTIAQSFVDMTSPVTVRNTVYETNQNNSYIQSSKPESEWSAENDTIALNTKSENLNQKNTGTNNSQNEGGNGGYIFWLSIVYFIGAVVFTGLFIATITNILRTRADRFKLGTINYKFKNHVVFIGYDDLIIGMIQKICNDEQERTTNNQNNNKIVRFFKKLVYIEGSYIVVGVESNASDINDRIKNKIYNAHKDKIVVLMADGCNRNELEKRLRVHYAESVYIIGEHDDAYNLKSYRTIYEISLCQKKFWERMPECYVNLRHKSTLTLFQTYAIASDIGVDFSYFHAFNFYDEWARFMIVGEGLKEEYRIDYRNGESNGSRQVHLVIAGMTEMGRALARQAILVCHYPKNTPTKITFIDPQANLYSKQLIGSHQDLFKRCPYTFFDSSAQKVHEPKPNEREKINKNEILDVEFEFYAADISDLPIRDILEKWAEDGNQLLTIAICLSKAPQNLAAGLYLPNKFFEKHIPIWIYQPTYGDLGNYLRGSKRYNNVVTFGMSGENLDICNENMLKKVQLINHYLNNHENGVVNYDNDRWMEMEWEALGIHEKWLCINRASRIPAINRMKDKDGADIDMIAKVELKRMKIERLIVPGASSDKQPLNEEDEKEYIKNFQ